MPTGDPARTKGIVLVVASSQAVITPPIVRVFWNGEEIGVVEHGGQFRFPIEAAGEVGFQYLFRKAKFQVQGVGVETIYLSWDRIWGRLLASATPSTRW